MALPDAAEGPLDPPLHALRELILAAEGYRQAVATQLDVSVTETVAVGHLYARGQLGQTELAELLGITTSSTTALIDRLTANGLAERRAHPDDRRRSNVVLTARGNEVVSWSRRVFARAFDEVPEADRRRVTRALLSMAAQLRSGVEELPDDANGSSQAVPAGRSA